MLDNLIKTIMKTLIKKIGLLGFLLSLCLVTAQEEKTSLNSIYSTYVLSSDFFGGNNGADSNQLTNGSSINNNNVNLTQIGQSNYSSIYVKSANSQLDIQQKGNDNYLDIYKNTSDLSQNILQSGNNNFISDFTLNTYNNVDLTINQEGNNLKVYNNGSNSISKNMIINQKGNSGTIYIFNH